LGKWGGGGAGEWGAKKTANQKTLSLLRGGIVGQSPPEKKKRGGKGKAGKEVTKKQERGV